MNHLVLCGSLSFVELCHYRMSRVINHELQFLFRMFNRMFWKVLENTDNFRNTV